MLSCDDDPECPTEHPAWGVARSFARGAAPVLTAWLLHRFFGPARPPVDDDEETDDD